MPTAPKNLRDFKSLVEVVKTLRGPDGCPWDKEQTHLTLTRFAIEEVYEMVEAMDQGDDSAFCEELGDVLLQVVLNAVIAEQRQAFSLEDVIETLNKKMIRRHPHVFGDVEAKSSAAVVANWNQIKSQEKSKSAVDGVFDFPRALSPLMAAQKIGEKSGRFRFDWPTARAVFDKVREEFIELEEAFKHGDPKEQAHEIGDLLFSLVQLARHLKLDAEQVLRQTNQRFEQRFRLMLKLIDDSGTDLAKLSEQQIEDFWQKAKTQLK